MSRNDCSPEAVSSWIVENFPREQEYGDPFKVLVSTILSQRTRDENTEEALAGSSRFTQILNP